MDASPQDSGVVSDSTVFDASREDAAALDATTQDVFTDRADSSPSDSRVDASDDAERGWDRLVATPNTWIYRARDAYRDRAMAMRVGHNDEVEVFRALGTAIPSVNNVPSSAHLLWRGQLDFQSPDAPVWYAAFGHKPTFVDRGGGDQYVRFVNGLPTNYETEPGQLTPPVARGEILHVVHLFRTMPGASYEALLASPAYKDRGGDGSQIQVLHSSTNLFGRSGAVTTWGEDNIVELLYRANGDVRVSVNGDMVLSGNIPDLPTTGFVECVMGTNSHITSHHFRALIMRRGAEFSADELAMIRSVTDALWPRGRRPTFPYLDGQFRNNYATWNATTKTFAPAVGTFTGGSGTAGAHRFQWYYWTDPGPASTWPRNNKLDYHRPFPGPRGQLASLVRADYEAGNSFGNPVIFTQPGQRTVSVMRVVTPVDSAGVEGEPLPGAWYPDENP